MEHVSLRRPPGIRHVNLGRPGPQIIAGIVTDDEMLPASAQLAAEGEAVTADLDGLLASRNDVLLASPVEDVIALDRSIEHARVRSQQILVQHQAAVAREATERAEHEAEQKRRHALRKQAVKASAEIARMADEYVEKAQQLVVLFKLIRQHEDLIEQANGALPDDAEPVPPGEPDNGIPGRPYSTTERVEQVFDGYDQQGNKKYRRHTHTDVTYALAPIPHGRLSRRAYLPGLGRDAKPIWGVSHYVNGEPR